MKFFAAIRRMLFTRRINREIYHKIFPHLNGQADHGYPFSSDDELHAERLRSYLNFRKMLSALDAAVLKMPAAEGNAFLYLAHRDLEEQIRQYLKFANGRTALHGSQEQQPVAAAA